MTDQTTEAPVAGATDDASQTNSQTTQVETTASTEAEAGTILGSEPSDKEAAAPATWPADWREQMAGGDEKLLARLKRFTAPANITKSWLEAEKKIASGELKKALPKDATPEQVSAWRKENGLPEAPDGYKFDLGGIVPSAEDAPILEGFKTFALENNLAPEVANAAAKWWFEQKETAVAAMIEADKAFNIESTVALRQEWGGEFKSNVNAMNTFLDGTMPQELKSELFGARLANGKLLGDHPEMLKWLSQVARDNMPGADLVPSGSPNVGKGIGDRISEIETLMRTDPEKYYSSGADKELMKLYDAQSKMQSRAA